MPTVYIIIYSLYHHIYSVAKDVQKGLESQGVTVKLFQVPETLSEEILKKLNAPPRPEIPVITIDDLIDADAFMFGIPTRFGTLPAQMKSFLDASGALWATGALAGKFAGTFFSTASQHGGQETTAYTLCTYFAHHGINYVPLGFANAHLFDNSEVVGGSAWGSGTIANGDGSRQATEKELAIAHTQGENFAKILNTFHRGQKLIESEKEVEPITQQIETTHIEPKKETVVETAAAEVPKTTTATTETKTTTTPAAAAAAATEPVKEETNKQTPRSTKPKHDEKKKESKCFCM